MNKMLYHEQEAFDAGYRTGTDAAIWFPVKPPKVRVPFLYKDYPMQWQRGFDIGFENKRTALEEREGDH